MAKKPRIRLTASLINREAKFFVILFIKILEQYTIKITEVKYAFSVERKYTKKHYSSI
jgi:hypothetical protein